MFESLQEGIVVIQDDSIAFMNSQFKRLFEKMESQTDQDVLLDQDIFKVYSKEDDGENVETSSRSGNSGNRFFTSGSVVSLNKIIKKLNPAILNDQIFQLE